MMMNMGYSRKEIEESLIQQKYNDVMATYLLLARRASDVSCIALFILTANILDILCPIQSWLWHFKEEDFRNSFSQQKIL